MDITKNLNLLKMRFSGCVGILGGLILFCGDMLLYYDPVSVDFRQNMAHASDLRIIASGVCALFAAWFYTLGTLQIYMAFKPSKPFFRNLVVLCFGGIFIAFGIVHAAYTAIAATAKLSLENNLDLNSAVALSVRVNDILRLFVYPIFGLLSLFFIRQVWIQKTLYPRWIIVFFPLLLFLLEGVITDHVPKGLFVIVQGGYLNLILIVFFTASTIALWNPIKSDENIKYEKTN